MKKFKLSAVVTISIYTEVEARSLEEAIEISQKRHIEVANNSDTEFQQQDAWISEEFDGEPYKIKEEK